MQHMRKLPTAGAEVGLLSDLMTQATADVPVTRAVTLDGRRVSVRLEASIWDGLIDIGERKSKSLDDLCAEIAQERTGLPLATAIRVFVLHYFRQSAEL